MWFKRITPPRWQVSRSNVLPLIIRCRPEVTLDSQIHPFPQSLRCFSYHLLSLLTSMSSGGYSYPSNENRISTQRPTYSHLPAHVFCVPLFDRFDLQILFSSFVGQILGLLLYSRPLIQKFSLFCITNFSSLPNPSHKDTNMLQSFSFKTRARRMPFGPILSSAPISFLCFYFSMWE